ncbi:putative membrane protein [Streptococcus pneumoniae GA06083]|uniref:Uncharacterized protein n=1 Tax=Streptococcus pneumoniae (strain JJA) TaxID=488222 RepID=C1CCS4_STRZJ|nr:conserved hypothetical protein [Streptococcus pneumoniae JJA]ACO21202.1 conserved hypothetical protein [Streptococcus pneumoniae P1031]AFS42639.1 hypothetical protein HMPREF1038_00566 [Streptococcus pneumoniae gamPNI0373]EDT95431.1 conserved hypothetical protein [Streptococcus pneumoniae CDC0288-04]EDT97381.1 conserved hypothetical protein [Streptococcus pneumoniae CDC3059-06]EHD27895.1 putative membrane protein [Streptococcus pneumoniae 4027-06]EHD31446.1 putative membrane protein [Strept
MCNNGLTFLLGPFAIGIGVTGAAGGAILGGVAYAATCWW